MGKIEKQKEKILQDILKLNKEMFSDKWLSKLKELRQLNKQLKEEKIKKKSNL